MDVIGWVNVIRWTLLLSTAVMSLYFVVSFFRAYRRVDAAAVDAVGWVAVIGFSELNLILLYLITRHENWDSRDLTFSLISQTVLFSLVLLRVLRWRRIRHTVVSEDDNRVPL